MHHRLILPVSLVSFVLLGREGDRPTEEASIAKAVDDRCEDGGRRGRDGIGR